MIFLVLEFENLKSFVLVAIPHELVREGEQVDILPRLKAGDSNSENHATHD